MSYGLIRINRERQYSDSELAEIRAFNHQLLAQAMPELDEILTVLEARPRNVVIFQLPEALAQQYEVLVKRYA